MAPRAFICGLGGTELVESEVAFLRDAQPWGVILFKRNVESADQVRRLCETIRAVLGRDGAPILIDQEGGRVQRIGPPLVRAYPAGAVYGELYARDALLGVEAARLGAKLMALELAALGVTVDCVPLLDVPVEGGTPAIGDRTLGRSVDSVLTLGAAQIEAVLSSGVLPVIKHIPGHGRATVDSHEELPRTDASLAELDGQDFAPFRLLAKDAPMAMTAHVVYSQLDPDLPATLSPTIIANIIRGRIGFDGVLMTDDISMRAISGGYRDRAEAAIRAGCDLVLHCNGDLAEAAEIAAGVPELQGEPLARTDRALAARRDPESVDRRALEARFDALLSIATAA